MVEEFGSPSSYIQGKGVLFESDKYLKNFGTKPLLLAGETVYKIVGKRFEQYLQENGYDVTRVQFNGESSTNEVNRVTEIGKENNVTVVYGLGGGIRNESTNLTSQINSLVDYYDSKYSIVAIGTNRDEKTSSITGNINFEASNYNNEYSKVIINTNAKIDAQKTHEIYVQFELNRDAILNIMNDGENLENVVEINSYSTFGEDGKA